MKGWRSGYRRASTVRRTRRVVTRYETLTRNDGREGTGSGGEWSVFSR